MASRRSHSTKSASTTIHSLGETLRARFGYLRGNEAIRLAIFDPSTVALGWSVWSLTAGAPRLESSGALPRGWSVTMSHALLAGIHARTPLTGAVVEDQFLGRGASSSIRLIEQRMRVQVVAELMGLPVANVLASVWQSRKLYVKGEKFPTRSKSAKAARAAQSIAQASAEVLGQPLPPVKAGRLTTHVPPTDVLKARSLALASRITSSQIVTNDESDAICLGEFVIDEIRGVAL